MKPKQLVIGLGLVVCQGFSQTTTPTATIQPGGGIDPTLAAPTKRVSINPPAAVAEAFEKSYPGRKDVIWKTEGDKFRVAYTDPGSGLAHEILYNKEGKVVSHETELDNASFPKPVVAWYTKKYPGVKFTVWQTEDSKGKRGYYIPRATEFIWFDESGNYSRRRERK